MMRHTLLIQQMMDHRAGRPADREDRDRIAAQRMDRTRDIDPAAAGIVTRRGTSQLVRWFDPIRGRGDVERRIHGQCDDRAHGTPYCAASERAATACSASYTTVVVRKRLAALTLIE